MFSVLSDWLLAGLGTVFSGAVAWAGRVEHRTGQNADRIDKNEGRIETVETQLQGDPDDPSAPGALVTVHQVSEQVDCLDDKLDKIREETRTEHETVMEKLEEVIEDE